MPDLIEIEIAMTPNGYQQFIECKKLPKYEVKGNKVITDEESWRAVFGDGFKSKASSDRHHGNMFDYQREITDRALRQKRYAAFLDCGLGKTRIELAYADSVPGRVLFLCPLAVLKDVEDEASAMGIGISCLRRGPWTEKIGLMNFEAMRAIDMRGVSGIVIDESSILKNGDGAIREYLTELAAGIEYRLCASATPSPNDQSEYATHSVLLGYSASLKEFYSRFFRKEGTDWILKPHAVEPFYHNLAAWSCYIKSPSALGFQRGGELDHEPNYIQLETSDLDWMPIGSLFANDMSLQDAGKIFGAFRASEDTERFQAALNAIKGKRAIIWCKRNDEEDLFKRHTKATIINGSTPEEERIEIIAAFRKGEINQIISKPKVLGFGVNLPQAEAMLYSGYDHSFEQFYQAVRRSHRYGRKGVLDVYIPMAQCEKPIWSTIERKIKTFENDCRELQARFFNVA